MKSNELFWRSSFLRFVMSYSESKPHPRRPCFLSDQNFFNESKRGSPKEHSCQIIMKSMEPLWRRRFLKFHYICHIVKISPPMAAMFFVGSIFFKESKRVPPKVHSCQIIMKSIEPFWRR